MSYVDVDVDVEVDVDVGVDVAFTLVSSVDIASSAEMLIVDM
jgi:hypothetical protein